MEYFVEVEGGVRVATEEELANVAVALFTMNEAGNMVAVDRSLLPTAIDATTPASTASATDPVVTEQPPVVSASSVPGAEGEADAQEDEISEPTEAERFEALVETTVDILHSKGWAFGNALQELVNRFK